MSNSKLKRFPKYQAALEAISKRTGTALPSLVVSFAILHEVTAIAPFIGLFFMARTLQLGERFTAFIRAETDADNDNWMKEKCKSWFSEGERWATRVGKRYNIWGFDSKESPIPTRPHNISGNDIGNAVVAYAATKVVQIYSANALSFYHKFQ